MTTKKKIFSYLRAVSEDVLTLLDKIGKGVEVHEMDADLIAEAVDYLEGHYSSLLMS
jgi:hypothetical protein